MTLASGFATERVNTLATDGVRLYVLQANAPLLWSIDVSGANRIDLYGADFDGSLLGSERLLPADGGLFFNTVSQDNEHLAWISAAGGPVRFVAPIETSLFDVPRRRALAASSDGFGPNRVEAVSLDDGTTSVVLTTAASDDLIGVQATAKFLHVVFLSGNPPRYTDRRYDLATMQPRDAIAFHVASSQITAGARALCGLADDVHAIRCIADDQDMETTLASGSPIETIPYIDADWVYAVMLLRDTRSLSRFAFVGGREQTLLSDGADAVTSLDGCVYVGSTRFRPQQRPIGTILRLSPAE